MTTNDTGQNVPSHGGHLQGEAPSGVVVVDTPHGPIAHAPEHPDGPNDFDGVAGDVPPSAGNGVLWLACAIFALLTLALVTVIGVGIHWIADHPRLTEWRLYAYSGSHVVPHLEWTRAVLVFGSLGLLAAFSVTATFALATALRRRAPITSPMASISLGIASITAGIASVLGTALLLLPFVVWADIRLWRRSPVGLTRRWLGAGTVVALVLIGVTVTGGIVNVHRFTGPRAVGIREPLMTDFWSLVLTQTPASDNQASAACGDPNDCMIVGNGYSSTAKQEFEVTATSDAGRHWKSELVPEATDYPGQVQCFNTTCVTHVQSRWGDSLARLSTTHPGRIRLTPVPPMGAISCASVSWCAGLSQEDGGDIAVTDNGGRTWSNEPVLTPQLQTGGGVSLRSVQCPAPGRCYVVAQLIGPGLPRPGVRMFIASTPDGGHSWSANQVPGTGYDDFLGACPTATECFATVSVHDDPALLATTDGAQNWQQLTLPVPGSSRALGEIGPVTCITAARCFAEVGERGHAASRIDWTSDGGATWRTTRIPTERGQSNEQVLVTWRTQTASIGVLDVQRNGLSTNPVLVQSNDSGSTWSRRSFPNP